VLIVVIVRIYHKGIGDFVAFWLRGFLGQRQSVGGAVVCIRTLSPHGKEAMARGEVKPEHKFVKID